MNNFLMELETSYKSYINKLIKMKANCKDIILLMKNVYSFLKNKIMRNIS